MPQSGPGIIPPFTVPLCVSIRPCVRDDLPRLEWFGLYTPHREIIGAAFGHQERGEGLMLVAVANNFPVGQVWIDLAKKGVESIGVLWAVRVFPILQGLGLGARLMTAAEQALRDLGYRAAELGVEKGSEGAGFYERLGYRRVGSLFEEYCYTTPDGISMRVPVDQWVYRKELGLVPANEVAPMKPKHRLAVRWTIGDVSFLGFEALRLSIWGAWRVFGPQATYAVCVNSIPLEQARARTGEVPEPILWHEATDRLPDFLRPWIDGAMAEGAGWKLAPLRLYSDAHELSLDNDCILWDVPEAVRSWLTGGDDPRRCLIAQDVRACFGQFAMLCGPDPCNAGIRGLPGGFDLEAAIRQVLAERPCRLTSEQDEQGLQVAAISRACPPRVASLDEVTICSPFPPHLPHLGRCGAHFVGLNAKQLPWSLDDRPAVDHIREHWRRHRRDLYEKVAIAPRAEPAWADQHPG